MSAIARQFFADSPVIVFPIFALLLFVAVFIVVTVRALRTQPSEIDALARIPLADDDEARHV
jgi:cbb3-type cytochrome oxidase subunit 3